jgi:hypothetical protein
METLQMSLTPEQRQAQRAVGGIIRSGSATLSRQQLSIWRAKGSEQWQAGAEEITAHLDALEVPYAVAIARGPTSRNAEQLGWQIQVAWDDLGTLEKWIPSLRRLINALEEAKSPPPTTERGSVPPCPG